MDLHRGGDPHDPVIGHELCGFGDHASATFA
jgi:hypothetical protein